jgi:hypothetical protein
MKKSNPEIQRPPENIAESKTAPTRVETSGYGVPKNPGIGFVERLKGVENEKRRIKYEGRLAWELISRRDLGNGIAEERVEIVGEDGKSRGVRVTKYDEESGEFIEFRRELPSKTGTEKGALMQEIMQFQEGGIVVREYNPQVYGGIFEGIPLREACYINGKLTTETIRHFTDSKKSKPRLNCLTEIKDDGARMTRRYDYDYKTDQIERTFEEVTPGEERRDRGTSEPWIRKETELLYTTEDGKRKVSGEARYFSGSVGMNPEKVVGIEEIERLHDEEGRTIFKGSTRYWEKGGDSKVKSSEKWGYDSQGLIIKGTSLVEREEGGETSIERINKKYGYDEHNRLSTLKLVHREGNYSEGFNFNVKYEERSRFSPFASNVELVVENTRNKTFRTYRTKNFTSVDRITSIHTMYDNDDSIRRHLEAAGWELETTETPEE